MRRKHRGNTLVELLATLSVLLMIGLSAATLLGKVAKIGRDANRDRQGRQAIVRIAEQLRADTQRASGVSLDDTSLVSIDLDDGDVIYRWDQASHSITRHEQGRTGGAADHQAVAHDRYLLPEGCQPTATQTDGILSINFGSPNQSSPWIVEVKSP